MIIPEWAINARVLAVRYQEIDKLEKIANYYQSNVVILYLVPETSNGWCPEGTYEQISNFISKVHKYGIKILTYFDSVCVEEKFYYGEHKDWVQRNPEGQPQHYQPSHISQHRYCNCINSPWRNYLLEIVKKEAKIGSDGILFDNPGYYEFCGPSCFCKYCQEKFEKEKGKSIFNVSRDEQKLWAHGQIGLFLKEAYEIFQKISSDKEIVITSNYSGPTYQNMKLLSAGENVLFHETSGQRGKELLKILKEDREIGGKKPIWTIRTIGVKGKERYSTDNVSEYEILIAEAVACGANPVLWCAPTSMSPENPGFVLPPFYEIPEFSQMVSSYYSFIKNYKKLFFNRDVKSFFEVKTEPQVLNIGYKTNNTFIIHLINYKKEAIKNLKIFINEKNIKNIKLSYPENSNGTILPISEEKMGKFVQISDLKKWAILIGR